MTGNTQEGSSSRASSRGRKRSFDEDEPEKNEDDAGHRRKRSRDSNSEEENANADVDVEVPQLQKGDEVTRDIAVPKKKRSRDQLDKDESTVGASGEKAEQNAAEEASTERTEVEGQPEKKRHTDDAREKESVGAMGLWYVEYRG